MTPEDPRYSSFPSGFFARADDSDDDAFYVPPRLVTHIDDAAIAAVGDLYDELELAGAVLDLCASWVSHFHNAPARLVALGMNEVELTSNPQATEWLVHDLNREGGATLPFPDGTFDAVTCCVSVDYLVHPIEVFDEVARVLRADGLFVCTFSNRCFPTKAIHGWLASDDRGRRAIVAEYFRRSGGWTDPRAAQCTPPGTPGDPLYAVWAARQPPSA